MWKANRTLARQLSRAACLIGFLALNSGARSHIVTTELPPPAAKDAIPTLEPGSIGLIRVLTVSNSSGDLTPVDSDFYLARTEGFDRPLSVTLAIIGAKAGSAMQITSFVTFLPGERQHLVAIRPIIQSLFDPAEKVFVRITPSGKTAT